MLSLLVTRSPGEMLVVVVVVFSLDRCHHVLGLLAGGRPLGRGLAGAAR